MRLGSGRGIGVSGGWHTRRVIDDAFNWDRFLRRWQDEWVPSEDDAEELADGGLTLADLAVAVPPAGEAEIAAA